MKDTTINIEETIQEINKQNKRIEELCLEIERLNNIIKRLETDLYNMYIAFGEFSEEYTENRIKKIKEGGIND